MEALNASLNTLFTAVLNRGISATWLILAVIVLRLVLKRAPKWISCLLWAMVAVQLICPLNVPSSLSVYNLMEVKTSQTGSVEYFSYNESLEKPEISIDFPAIPGYPDNQDQPVAGKPVHTSDLYLPPIRTLWLIGIAGIALYGLISYLDLRKKVGPSLHVRDDLWICDDISSPFILGVLRPRIYLPSTLEQEELLYVVAHEKAHLQRRDHWWKPLGFLLLAVYWFHPLVWAAYLLLCRDIELACDEKVCRNMEPSGRTAYAQALLKCSISRWTISACPLAFGEVSVKERVKSVLNARKPAFWVLALCVLVCVVTGVCFLTDPIPYWQKDPECKVEANHFSFYCDPEQLTVVKNSDDGQDDSWVTDGCELWSVQRWEETGLPTFGIKLTYLSAEMYSYFRQSLGEDSDYFYTFSDIDFQKIDDKIMSRLFKDYEEKTTTLSASGYPFCYGEYSGSYFYRKGFLESSDGSAICIQIQWWDEEVKKESDEQIMAYLNTLVFEESDAG